MLYICTNYIKFCISFHPILNDLLTFYICTICHIHEIACIMNNFSHSSWDFGNRFNQLKIQTCSVIYQWWIQKFQNLGTRSRRGRILGVWGLFWYTFTCTLSFYNESKEENTYCNHCMLTTIKVYGWYKVKINKNNPQEILDRLVRPCASPGSVFLIQKAIS